MRHIYLLRHGQAQGHSPQGDAGRALTERGRSDVRQTALGLKRLGVRPDRILHSPYVRAQQTAQIAAEVLGVGALKEDAGLTPVSPAAPAADRVLDERGTTLVVAHLPILPAIACELLRAEVSIDLATAGVLYLAHPGGPSATLIGAWPTQTFSAA